MSLLHEPGVGGKMSRERDVSEGQASSTASTGVWSLTAIVRSLRRQPGLLHRIWREFTNASRSESLNSPAKAPVLSIREQ